MHRTSMMNDEIVRGMLELSPEDATAIYEKLYSLATPFDHARFGLPGRAAETALVGKPSVSSPAPVPQAA